MVKKKGFLFDEHHFSPMTHTKKHIRKGVMIFAIFNLFWLLLRTGQKPSRITYPCQQAALTNVLAVFPTVATFLIGLTISTNKFFKRWGKPLGIAILIGSSFLIIEPFLVKNNVASAQNPNQEIQLSLVNNTATISPSSTIYAANGRPADNIGTLINLMTRNGLDFYSLIKPNDVVIIKINAQWSQRGGTDTDLVKELIQAILNHPNGFTGEIIVADNGQGYGSMQWTESNAENTSQSTQNVVDKFAATGYKVSTSLWDTFTSTRVAEFQSGDTRNGYILNETADSATGIFVSYPKFTTKYGTQVSFKLGIWNGTNYEKRLKIINMPVLKSHQLYGVSAASKNYMGVQSEGQFVGRSGLANGHPSVATGGMGKLMTETTFPTLNILCAVWVNAIPLDGPITPYSHATRTNIIAASTDPIALDYWASKNILVPTARAIGYTDTHTLDPDSTDRTNVNGEALGIWLPKTRDALTRAGYKVTMNPQQINVYVTSGTLNVNPTTVSDYDGLWHNSNFAINLAASSPNSIFETYYRINTGSVQTLSVNGQPIISTSGSNNTLEYWSVDVPGNEELPHKMLTGIKLDKIGPTGTILINDGASNTTSNSVVLSLTTSDTISGVYQVRFSNDANSWGTWENPTISKTWSLTMGNGMKTVYYQVKDNAGLISSTFSANITLITNSISEFPSHLLIISLLFAALTLGILFLKRKTIHNRIHYYLR